MIGPLGIIALITAATASAILLWFLIVKPPLVRGTKLALLIGVLVLPLASAATGNLSGYNRTMERGFCGNCHTMDPYVADSNDPFSETLPAVHGRNEMFGDRNCYTCHADYGMFGTVLTKTSGLKHVWHYYTHYRSVPVEESLNVVELYKPFPNANCTHCHSMQTPMWRDVPEHESAIHIIETGKVTCASDGCHGPAHPFSKLGRVKKGDAP